MEVALVRQSLSPTDRYLVFVRDNICSHITPAQRLLLLTLASYADWQTGEARPSQKTLAEKLAMDRGHVSRLLKQLCAEGLIVHARDHKADSGRCIKVWKLVGYDRFIQPSLPNDAYEPTIGPDKLTVLLDKCAPAPHEQELKLELEQQQQESPESDNPSAAAAVSANSQTPPAAVPAGSGKGDDQAQHVRETLLESGVSSDAVDELISLGREANYVRRVVATSVGKRNPAGFIVTALRAGNFQLPPSADERRETQLLADENARKRRLEERAKLTQERKRMEEENARVAAIVEALPQSERKRLWLLAIERITLVEGREYADFVLSRGPLSQLGMGLVAELAKDRSDRHGDPN